MQLSDKTLRCLREMINERTEYRSGPNIIAFFNALGFNDSYGQGFPSRWVFTDDQLSKINGTAKLDACIKNTFAPINFIGRFAELDKLISEFDEYLAFDKWRLERNGAELQFCKLERVEIKEPPSSQQKENEFLSRDFADLRFDGMGLEPAVQIVIEQRVKEIENCFAANSPLAVILLVGSSLEGILLGVAQQFPRQFNSASAAPKDKTGTTRAFQEWALNGFIDVARELGLIEHDTQRFSHVLKDFRNYIHPFQQLASEFSPRDHTAKICLQVFKAASQDLRKNISKLRS